MLLPKLFFISILSSLISATGFTHSYSQCLHHQKSLLLQLKNELIFDSSVSTKLVRWNQTHDCCKWYGVDCDDAGYVISLQLDDESITGGIGDSSSLFRLEYLEKLNLAYNDFNSTPIPKGIHNLSYLTHLDLSYAGFAGQVPAEITSLRRLVSLDISIKPYWLVNEPLMLEYPNLEMLVQNMTGLRELYLNNVNITSSHERTKWSHIISSYLPYITAFGMRGCSLSGPLAKSFWQLHSLTQLTYVDLSRNLFTGSLSSTLFEGLSSLVYLNLEYNSFSGNIPLSLFGLPSLKTLYLRNNHFTGQVEEFSIVNVSNIVGLDLRNNQLDGPIPDSLFQLQSLKYLLLSDNLFSGTFQLEKIQSLASLRDLDLSDNNNLSIDVSNHNSTTYGLPQLTYLGLASCNMHDFPDFIKHSDNIRELDLSNNGIGGEIPSWIWRLTQLHTLNLSHNLLTGLQKPYHIPSSLYSLDLSSNQLRGELNLLIPPNITISSLRYLLLSNNSLSGSIPTSLLAMSSLTVLDLGQNNISGRIPDTFSPHCTLQYFDLNNNTLEGKIPKSLQNCKWLQFVNVGNNIINDTFPCMLPSSLRVLVLHSNTFQGEVTCHNSWPDLQILDISSNHFGGSLETINFSSWRGMVQGSDSQLRHKNSVYFSLLSSGVTLIIKGLQVELHKIWSDLSSIDLSCNNFRGEIPNEIGDLSLLHQLNLSHNALNGSIPKSFGKLGNLEALDLSRNQLTGAIPMELASLTFLSSLNLSYNMLVGEIPNGRQLQTFSGDSFKGNPWLCGFNLNISCNSHTVNESDLSHEKVEEKKREIEWEYVSAALGYVVGLGSIVWLLLFCRSFRKKYFDKIDDVVEQIFNARDMRRKRRATARRRAVRNRVRRQ